MVNKFFIYEENTVKDALKALDSSAEKALLVVDKQNHLLGAITDGDIRRFILKGKQLDDTIKDAYNRKPLFLRKGQISLDSVKELFLTAKISLLPIVDSDNKVDRVLLWDEVFFSNEPRKAKPQEIDLPIVIMAGGKGTRMDPFTKILPKPLIPVGDTPIVELIINEFRKCGANNFYLTLNYKKEIIEAYFNNLEKDYKVNYLIEKDFYGTAGSLKLLEKIVSGSFIVSNCDVIVKADFAEVLKLHKESKAVITVLSSIQHHKVPYGVIKAGDQGAIIDIVEKPEYSMMINTGVYVIDSEVLTMIPKEKVYDMPQLIKDVLASGKKVAAYPVNSSEYMDIGQWEEYKKTVEKLQIFA